MGSGFLRPKPMDFRGTLTFKGDSRDPQQWDPLMGSFSYYSHTTPIRIPKDMGMVWEAYHKGGPIAGGPWKIPLHFGTHETQIYHPLARVDYSRSRPNRPKIPCVFFWLGFMRPKWQQKNLVLSRFCSELHPQSLTWNLKMMHMKKVSPLPGAHF